MPQVLCIVGDMDDREIARHLRLGQGKDILSDGRYTGEDPLEDVKLDVLGNKNDITV